ncbi:MAG TPA: nucleotidyltransferase domain-containing protein [Candidatus Kapabacteria bacterium]|jgi:predicted nucleotidyltransferase|nr:nucleotidyltransferase domain-containing protein [Candidatus Kapabacteria bacterium]
MMELEYKQDTGNHKIDDALFHDIAARIVEAFHPKRIILFGSWARGDYDVDSDVDIFVEMETLDVPVERRLKVRRLFRDRWWPMDILVYTPEEVRVRSQTAASIVPEILREGITLYEQSAQR